LPSGLISRIQNGVYFENVFQLWDLILHNVKYKYESENTEFLKCITWSILNFKVYAICLLTLESLSNRDMWPVVWTIDGFQLCLSVVLTGRFKTDLIYSMWIIGLIYINLNPPASTFTEGPRSTDATGSFHFKYLYMVHT
jgi:hypothetical protein